MKKYILVSMLGMSIVLLTGCAAIGTAVSHRNLQTQTLMSDSIFLSPSAVDLTPTVFIMVTNTTDHPQFLIANQIERNLKAKGYQILQHPNHASFILQVNILQVGKNSKSAAKEMMASGYGGALEGVVSGVAIAASGGANLVVGGIAGGVATSVTDNFVQNVTYTVISDVKLIQNISKSKSIENKTRVLSMANRVNLSFPNAEAKLEIDLSHAISGLFIEQKSV